MHRGYIKLWRKLFDNKMWSDEKFTRGQAMVDLILLANHKDGHIRKRGIRVEIKRGEVGWSERELAERWKWSRGKVRRYLQELTKNEQFLVPQTEPQNINVTSRYKIANYDTYQGSSTTNDTTNGPQTDRKQYQNKNDKNEKKVKKKIIKKKKAPQKFIPPTLEDVIDYFLNNDFSPELAKQFYDYYSNGNPSWHDGNGKPVRSWKQKAIAVWFKDKNKPNNDAKPTTYAQLQDYETRQQVAAVRRYERECQERDDTERVDQNQLGFGVQTRN